jgi:hypothetical protein
MPKYLCFRPLKVKRRRMIVSLPVVTAMSRHDRLSRLAFAAAMTLCVGTFAAHAQDDVVERQLKAAPGRDVRAGVFTDIRPDCTSGPLPAIRLATPPAHGSVTVKRGTLKATNIKQCLALEVPAFVAFYRASADYSGADDFELEIGLPNGHKRRERVHVTVTKSSSTGEGI